ncbi:hypothetical protein D1872_177880 [compost metagenome]
MNRLLAWIGYRCIAPDLNDLLAFLRGYHIQLLYTDVRLRSHLLQQLHQMTSNVLYTFPFKGQGIIAKAHVDGIPWQHHQVKVIVGLLDRLGSGDAEAGLITAT